MLSLTGYSTRFSLSLTICCTIFVVYEGNIMTVFNYLKDGYNSSFNRFYQENSGVDASKKGPGSISRSRTQQYLGLGQASAEATKVGMKNARRGVSSAFQETDMKQARQSLDIEKNMADFINAIESDSSDNPGPPIKEEPELTLSEKLYGKKGTETGPIASNSLYNTPIPEEGFTRNAGGASKESQEAAIKEIIRVGRTLEATPEQIAYALAIARYESGFNMYAAAKSTSAYGLGQFINKTGKEYGLTADNRNDLGMQAQALIEHTIDNFDTAKKKGYDNSYIYALHHDGPSLDKGGLSISKEHIMPFVADYKKLLETYQ